jgi:hypothetical protein
MIYSIRKDGVLIDTNSVWGQHDHEIWDAGVYWFKAVDTGIGGSPLNITFTVIDDPTVPLSMTFKSFGNVLFLQGAFDPMTNSMTTLLKDLPDFPITEPYTGLGWLGGGPGGEIIDPTLVSNIATSQIVDWVRLEIRSATAPSVIVATKHLLLNKFGQLSDPVNGGSFFILNLLPGDYQFAIHHRNHLPVITMPVKLLGYAYALGFASPYMEMAVSDTRVTVSPTRKALRAGNAFVDPDIATIKYTGFNNDRDVILQRIGGQIPTNTTSGYHIEDVNLDGIVKYTGAANDRDVILLFIGGVVPTAVITAPIP